jgi:hypothetical protein
VEIRKTGCGNKDSFILGPLFHFAYFVAKQTKSISYSGMKMGLSLLIVGVLLFSSSLSPASDRYLSIQMGNDPVATNKILLKIDAGSEMPSRFACWVPGKKRDDDNQLTDEEIRRLDWKPFEPELLVDLGPGMGSRRVWLVAGWENPTEYRQEKLDITVVDFTPQIFITNPTNRFTSQPWLQLIGYANGDPSMFDYDITNSAGLRTHLDVFPTDKVGWDEKKFDWTKFCFQAYDIALEPGTNLITFHCEIAGNLLSTNIEIIFSTANDTNPPVITPVWPTSGMFISSATFIARGTVDDYTASMKGIVSGGGQTNEIGGLVERNGTFWVENIPLLAETNLLALISADASGNTSQTNLVIYKGGAGLVIETTPQGDDLWKASGLVTGRVKPGYEVYVNGAKADVSPDGHWRVEKAPIYGRGTATFDVTAVPSTAAISARNSSAGITNLLTSKAALGADPIVLNPTQPACGNFTVHLTGTAGKSFVLMASTDLLQWTPILTNFNSSAEFDYTDTNAANYPCRFFRVEPLPR